MYYFLSHASYIFLSVTKHCNRQEDVTCQAVIFFPISCMAKKITHCMPLSSAFNFVVVNGNFIKPVYVCLSNICTSIQGHFKVKYFVVIYSEILTLAPIYLAVFMGPRSVTKLVEDWHIWTWNGREKSLKMSFFVLRESGYVRWWAAGLSSLLGVPHGEEGPCKAVSILSSSVYVILFFYVSLVDLESLCLPFPE